MTAQIRNPQSPIRNFLSRLLPAPRRPRAELVAEERLKLLAHVADGDPCLRAVTDMLDDMLEGNASVAFDVEKPPEQRLIAASRAGIAMQILKQLEDERAQGRAWVERQRELGRESIQ